MTPLHLLELRNAFNSAVKCQRNAAELLIEAKVFSPLTNASAVRLSATDWRSNRELA